MHEFSAPLKIIGVNPYVEVPEIILADLHRQAGRSTGSIPIYGHINDKEYTQTLVRYAGVWRLYVNMKMLKDSPKRIGETVHISVALDLRARNLAIHPKLKMALQKDLTAKQVYDSLPPSRRHEINRYICNLKSETKVAENVQRAINFLNGNGRFVGRDRPR